MDFQIAVVENKPELLFDKNENIQTNLWVLMNIDKGSFFQDLTLGNELFKIKKITPHTLAQAKQMVQDCLKTLITSGRATSIDVLVEQDSQNMNQMNIKVQAKQPDGLIITYSTFKSVV